jgi:RNA polymerase sigma-70 factor, ECF subfamily
LTLLLNRMAQGDSEAAESATQFIYAELHRIASRELGPERRGHILQTTALVNEAYLRLAESASLEFRDRGHFFAVASRQMRRILVDYARKGKAARRGGGAVAVGLDSVQIRAEDKSVDVLLLDQALDRLKQLDARATQVVELRYFGGYSENEVADAVGIALITVRRDWEFAKSWLLDFMIGNK